jgi:hypothetical protein
MSLAVRVTQRSIAVSAPALEHALRLVRDAAGYAEW